LTSVDIINHKLTILHSRGVTLNHHGNIVRLPRREAALMEVSDENLRLISAATAAAVLAAACTTYEP
jgi:hypothetical protein